MSLPGGSITTASTSYERQSNHTAQLICYFVPNHPLFVEKVLVNLDASLQIVWMFTELQIGLVGQTMSNVPLSFECLFNVAPLDILLTMFIYLGLWNVFPSLEG